MMAQKSFYIAAEEAIRTEAVAAKRPRIEPLLTPTNLNEKQQKLFDYLVNVDNFEPVFVTGSAGTGKSALLSALRDHWQSQNKSVYICAYTHLAARNIKGKTCHSQFGFDFKLNLMGRWAGLPQYLILDEVSMIPDKMLDGIDTRLRRSSRDYNLPFGGVNVVAFGDLYQLPPVEDRLKKDKVLPPFESDVWNTFRLYELTENMRQSEVEFIKNLNLLRVGDNSCVQYFDTLVFRKCTNIEEKSNCTSLVSTHKEADSVNVECYDYISRNKAQKTLTLTQKIVPFGYKMIVFNADQEMLIFKKDLKVCVGTRVMVTHTTTHFCNGDTGVIERITDLGLFIRREHDDEVIKLDRAILHFATKIKGHVKYVSGLPIAYGWAVTIHKAQGMTLKNLTIYPSCVFAPGQAYVAASRCTHSSGLKFVDSIPVHGIFDMSNINNVYAIMDKLVI
ncbi:helicase-2 [Matsumuraeses phaseoli granulovirus]|uniref:Helicase-2 n=1 Tax=Matsumuraeses phaseoli granulovirus TaxID=2760664 RepID=A0AAE7MLK2_9BBAC|nr:helicase-2 [Matsumuraeses phaseoli granulovirus]QOD40078.1 helicase-2 [Matsumuraeses phaseoli granulovirus]